MAKGKPICKAKLQQELGLPQRADVPLVGFIGRLVEQKGMDLVAELLQQWVQMSDVQWVFLGTGEAKYHRLFERLVERFPQKIAVKLEFSDPLAHRIEAGTDLFLMPSRYEPCGLNQLYSLKYGTPPVVRETGGLADTIVNATEENLAAGTATGFSFGAYTASALYDTVKWALHLYRERPADFTQVVRTAMAQDWSWDRSAAEYEALYQSIRR